VTTTFTIHAPVGDIVCDDAYDAIDRLADLSLPDEPSWHCARVHRAENIPEKYLQRMEADDLEYAEDIGTDFHVFMPTDLAYIFPNGREIELVEAIALIDGVMVSVGDVSPVGFLSKCVGYLLINDDKANYYTERPNGSKIYDALSTRNTATLVASIKARYFQLRHIYDDTPSDALKNAMNQLRTLLVRNNLHNLFPIGTFERPTGKAKAVEDDQ
jgi:hypothetical protein